MKFLGMAMVPSCSCRWRAGRGLASDKLGNIDIAGAGGRIADYADQVTRHRSAFSAVIADDKAAADADRNEPERNATCR